MPSLSSLDLGPRFSLSLWYRSQSSSSPQWRRRGSPSSWKPTCTMKFRYYLWVPPALANQPSRITSSSTFPKIPTCPTVSISLPELQPIKPRISSCPSWIDGGRAFLGLPWGRKRWCLWVRTYSILHLRWQQTRASLWRATVWSFHFLKEIKNVWFV